LLNDVPCSQLIAWYYTPMALPFTRELNASVTVYDNMDELSAFRGASPSLLRLESELLRRADVVFTGGQSLYEAKAHRHKNIHAFPSSIDANHFRRARGCLPDPSDQAAIRHPRLGFFGVIDERMDLDLLARCAELRPHWQFVMLGPTAKIDPRSLPRQDNVHWLGEKSYAELPAYLGNWELGIMPFAINEATRFISPTKTPEFLSAGLPVISTPITDVVRPYARAGLVQIVENAQQLVERAEVLMRSPRQEWVEAVDRHLAGQSWDKTWQGMRQHLLGEALRKAHLKASMQATGAAEFEETAGA
jgi:glycosyltransferase involved in cell wall biosynthesis